MTTVERVLVTGSTGFLATHVVDQLLKAGYAVRGTVRTKAKHKDVARRWNSFGVAFEAIVVPDLIDADLSSAMNGVSAVVHVASPFILDFKDVEKELLDPAIKGTLNVLIATHAAGIKRIIVTSSIATVFDVAKGGTRADYTYGPNDWNTLEAKDAISGKYSPLMSYGISKALAERAAWDFAAQHPDIQLTTINPTMLPGPPVQAAQLDAGLNTSVKDYYDLVRGGLDHVPATPVPFFVDVRDAALAHVLALKNDSVIGKRVILNAGTYTLYEVAQIIKKDRPALASRLPQLTGSDEPRSRFARIDTSIATKDLGMSFIPLEKSVLDTIDALVNLESKL